jgi:magnesium chelatase family protein
MPDPQRYVFAGELSLTGAIVSVGAPLAIALAVARSEPDSTLILPPDGAVIATRVPGLTVLAAGTLSEVVAHFAGRAHLTSPEPLRFAPVDSSIACLSDVRGQASARRALEIAAAGAHSLLMAGPPGAGKSMLAHRLPGLLPRLSHEHALEVAALASITGRNELFSDVPPFRAPHHSASAPALVGGGASPRPGEISLAHRGVLFLDELPEFERRVLESLREPLETGWLGHKKMQCTCGVERIQKYRSKLSGPLLDRVDLQIALPAVDVTWLDMAPGESSKSVRERVVRCRQRQELRQARVNAQLDVSHIEEFCVMQPSAKKLLQEGLQRWNWSARVVHRVLRVARTLADLDEQDVIDNLHVAEAIQYRQPWGN